MSVLELVWHRPSLYPKQEAALFGPERFSACEASTKSGKTTAATVWLVEQALRGGEGDYLWVSPSFSQSSMVYRRLKRMLPRDAIARTNDSDATVTLANRAVIWHRSGDRPDLLYGHDNRAAVLDEASRVNEECWIAVRSTLSATGGPARLIGNVSRRRDWYWSPCRKIESGAEPDWTYHRLTHHDATEAGIIDPGDIEEARRRLPEKVFRALYEAVLDEDSIGLFTTSKLQVVRTAEADPTAVKVRAWDMAASATTRSDYTVGALMRRGLDDEVIVADVVRGRWEPDEVLDVIVQTAIADGPTTEVILEEEKGSSGRLLAEAVRRRLEGAGAGMVHSAKISGDKTTRAYGLAGCVGAGNLVMVEASWNDDVIREMDAFPGPEHDDIIDALSLGYNWLDENRQVVGGAYYPATGVRI